MTPQDILNATPDIDRNLPVLPEGEIHFALIGQVVPLQVTGPHDDNVVAQEMADDLSALLAVSPDKMAQLEALSSDICTRTCEETDYDMIAAEHVAGEDELGTCRRAYGMNDDGSMPSGLVASWLSFFGLDIPNGAYVRFNPPWEEEHDVLVRLEDGACSEFGLKYYGPNTATHRLSMPA